MTIEQRQYKNKILEALSTFVKLAQSSTFDKVGQRQISELRSYLMPERDDDFFSEYISEGSALYTSEHGNTNVINPSPYEAVKRSTAGFLSFHHTPYESFFKTQILPHSSLSPEQQKETLQYWHNRDTRTHSIMQQGYNLMQEALFIMERLVFNLGCKTLDIDSNLQVRKTQHPVENILSFSSNGIHQDILGVKENLNQFQFYMRFPDPILEPEKNNPNYKPPYDFTENSLNTTSLNRTTTVYRFNLGISVFNTYMENFLHNHPQELETFKKEFSRSHKLDNSGILDITLKDDGTILQMSTIKYRTIIIGNLGTIYKHGIRGKSQGDLALPIAKALQEAELIAYNGYERTFGPMFLAANELESRINNNLAYDDIIYTDNPDGFKPLNFNIDIRTAYDIIDKWQHRIGEIMFLPIFNLIEKNRMPVTEINIRRSDGFKQLGLYVAADTATNLEPETLSVAKMDEEENNVSPPRISDGQLKVTYISPVIQAIKSTTLDEALRVLTIFGNMEKLDQGVTRRNIDFDSFSNKVLDKTNNTDISLSPEAKQLLMEQERLRQEIAEKEALARAGRESDQRLLGLENAQRNQQPIAPAPA